MIDVVNWLISNGIGQNITATFIIAPASGLAGWLLRGRLRHHADRWVGAHLDRHHEALHDKLDEVLERLDDAS